MNKNQLIQDIRSGDEKKRDKAISTLFSDEDLRIQAFAKMGDCSYAEKADIFQEAMIVLDSNIRLDKFRQESSLFTYFISICRNLAGTSRRKKTKYREVELGSDVNYGKVRSEFELIQEEKYKERIKEILDALISKLSKGCQEALRKKYYEGLSGKELSVSSGISHGSVRSKLSECRKKLRKLVKQNQELLGLLKS
jgi:RNA polymerase sigma factor, sigma-70 family